MPTLLEKTDQPLLELLRETGGLGIQELMDRLAVTATAVRQRLDRLCAASLVEKVEIRAANRGRPSHRYQISESGLRILDRNMVELAKVVWDEIQAIDDLAVRNYLLGRISRRLAAQYGGAQYGAAQSCSASEVSSNSSNSRTAVATSKLVAPQEQTNPSADSLVSRLEKLADALRSRQFPVVVQQDPATKLPILKINGCPYPELSGQSHDICEVEEAMFSELLGERVKLRHCRCDSPDGGCVFDVVGLSASPTSATNAAN